jgi:hypothetical protein
MVRKRFSQEALAPFFVLSMNVLCSISQRAVTKKELETLKNQMKTFKNNN